MEKIIKLMSGKKTYAIGILMIFLGLLQGDNGVVLEGLAFITMRAGVAGLNK